MKFFGKLFKRKEPTVVGKEILNTYNICLSLFQTSFYKRLLYHQFLCCGCSKLFRGGEMYPFERPVCALPMFQGFTIEAREVVKLQRINIVVAVCQNRQSSIIFQRDLRYDLPGCVSPGLQTRYPSNL